MFAYWIFVVCSSEALNVQSVGGECHMKKYSIWYTWNEKEKKEGKVTSLPKWAL